MLRELEEDIKRAKWDRFWSSFGSYLVGASLIIVLATVGAVVWQNHQRQKNAEATLLIDKAQMLAANGKTDDAVKMLAEVKEGSASLIAMAHLQQAKMMLHGKDKAQAISLLATVADDGQADPAFRQMARLLILANAEKHDDALKAQMQALAADGSVFANSSREMLAMAELEAGKPASAVTLLKQITDDPDAPPAMKERAGKLYLSLASAQSQPK